MAPGLGRLKADGAGAVEHGQPPPNPSAFAQGPAEEVTGWAIGHGSRGNAPLGPLAHGQCMLPVQGIDDGGEWPGGCCAR